jgi:Zn-dependent protease with chaperone function
MQAVVAHECGYIVCHHVLYHTMADMLLTVGAAAFSPVSMLSEPMKLALLYWYRRSELSAERAAAVVLKSAKSVVDLMVRLTGGPKAITGTGNLERYLMIYVIVASSTNRPPRSGFRPVGRLGVYKPLSLCLYLS